MLLVQADTFVLLMRSLTEVVFIIERMEKSGAQIDKLAADPQAQAATGGAIDAFRQEARGEEERLRGLLPSLLENVIASCASLELELARMHARRILEQVAPNQPLVELISNIKELAQRIDDECNGRLFLFVPPARAEYFVDESPFGERVKNKFPKLAEDIAEVSKCFATGRYTAAVFHLMRVMEVGVTRVAKALGVTIPSSGTWGAMLGPIDRAINSLPAATTKEKTRRDTFAEAAAHLRHTKNAWRNNTMHPKETYTEEEAKTIFQNVRAFTESLVSLR
jgi:hypothetical protein